MEHGGDPADQDVAEGLVRKPQDQSQGKTPPLPSGKGARQLFECISPRLHLVTRIVLKSEKLRIEILTMKNLLWDSFQG